MWGTGSTDNRRDIGAARNSCKPPTATAIILHTEEHRHHHKHSASQHSAHTFVAVTPSHPHPHDLRRALSFCQWCCWLYTMLACIRQLVGLLLSGQPIPQHIAFIMDGNRRYRADTHRFFCRAAALRCTTRWTPLSPLAVCANQHLHSPVRNVVMQLQQVRRHAGPAPHRRPPARLQQGGA